MDLIFSFLALIVAITIHEYAHSLSADRLGDPTPRAAGRLSLNPLVHLDPLGTIMIFFAHFGWGKPVPIDPYNFRYPRRDEIIVALSGPLSNLILGSLLGLLYQLFNIYHPLLWQLAIINFSLAIFNLLPIPPLDGSKILLNLLPLDTAQKWEQAFSQYGFFLIAILLFLPFGGSNLISLLVTPVVSLLNNFFFPFI